MILDALGIMSSRFNRIDDALAEIRKIQLAQGEILSKIESAVQPEPAATLVLTLGKPEPK